MADALAMLVEMRGTFRWAPDLSTWVVAVPSGDVSEYADIREMIWRSGDDPDDLVRVVHGLWVAAGRPAWPVPVEIVAVDDLDDSEIKALERGAVRP